MKKATAFAIFTFLTFVCFSQVSLNPTNDFYIDALRWEQMHYTKDLPQTRPYPLNIVKRILDDVKENAPEAEAKRAEHYITKYFTHFLHVYDSANTDIRLVKVDSGGDENVSKYEADAILNESLGFSCDWQANNFLGLSCDFGALVRTNGLSMKEALPRFVRNDNGGVALPIKAEAGDADFMLNPNIIFTWGDERMRGSFGINRSGYGLFFDDSLVQNPNAYQMLNASFAYSGRIFDYTQTFAAPFATSYTDDEDFAFGKFTCFHAIKFKLPKRWSISLYESVVFHKPFMAAYFMPVPYFIISNVAGGDDNVMSGINFTWQPGCVGISVDLLLDDFNPKKLMKLKFNDAAIRTAFKFGFVYTPLDSPCEFVSVNYTLVTPYTYTKYNKKSAKYNFLDYTNFGSPLGTNLPPNSDTVSMTISWRMFQNFRLRTSTSFSRHGNPYQDFEDDEVLAMTRKHYNSDGSINSDTRGVDTATDYTGFLKQHDVMYIMQASLFAEYEQKIKKAGSLTLQFQYTFEYVNKDGVDSPIYKGRYMDAAQVQAAKLSWQEALHDSFNHYFIVGLKYLF